MKTTLLKMFRSRFEVIAFGSRSFALLDHKAEIVHYKILGSEHALLTSTAAIQVGVRELLSFREFQKLVETRKKRMYRSLLTKRP